jgi:hypothetical protein
MGHPDAIRPLPPCHRTTTVCEFMNNFPYGLGDEDLEDYVLSRHEGLRQSIEDADREYQKKGGVPLVEALKLRRHDPESEGRA